MALFTDVEDQVAALRDLFGDDISVDALAARMSQFGGDKLVRTLRAASALARCAERISIVGTGLVAARSARAAGQNGLAQGRGHRTPAALVQEITGVPYGEAQRQVRLGLAILESDAARRGQETDGYGRSPSWGADGDHRHGDGSDGDDGSGSDDAARAGDGAGRGGVDAGDEVDVDNGGFGAGAGFGFGTGAGASAGTGEDAGSEHAPRHPWHASLSTAMMQGTISGAQQDAIQRGLGQPTDDSDGTHAAWTAAAELLIADAAERTVEELRIQARAIRDRLDPERAERRFAQRYERRAFRTWIDADGRERGHIEFEDEGAAWMRAIRDAALRPRRGGPRFVDSEEAQQADDLAADSRTNDQLFYDLLMDLLRTGALADAKDVFGTRQAGVRLVQMQAADGTPTSARTEDYGLPVPFASVQQRMCESGAVQVTIDSRGNPLDVGREHRLFTPPQRIALAVRDGGCRWRGCDRPASYCEAHHIDEWHADRGRTDIDRGILLCRHHHMQLHHGGWRITREGKGEFLLHPPGNKSPVPLRARAALTAAWAGIDPPPRRFRPAA